MFSRESLVIKDSQHFPSLLITNMSARAMFKDARSSKAKFRFRRVYYAFIQGIFFKRFSSLG